MRNRTLDEAPSHVRFFTYAYAVVVGLSPGPALLAVGSAGGTIGVFFGLGALVGSVLGALALTRHIGRRSASEASQVLSGVLFLLVMPTFGLFLDAAADACEAGKCTGAQHSVDRVARAVASRVHARVLPLRAPSRGAVAAGGGGHRDRAARRPRAPIPAGGAVPPGGPARHLRVHAAGADTLFHARRAGWGARRSMILIINN